ncbi:40S ribosomal protein S15a [Pteropus alecto]|uniref:40S ribosomal protein S15a n=1 Tax=Pteropus alecto TaxID=9402 RepID=L5KNB6_PTEAL|nr:40S ribosomal protein S15a [Pteropus alecto]
MSPQELKGINNAKKRGPCLHLIRPCSEVVFRFLIMMMKRDCISEFEIMDDRRAGKTVGPSQACPVSLDAWY